MEGNLYLFNNEALWDLIKEQHGNHGGVYKIIAVEDGKRKPINRFLALIPTAYFILVKPTRSLIG